LSTVAFLESCILYIHYYIKYQGNAVKRNFSKLWTGKKCDWISDINSGHLAASWVFWLFIGRFRLHNFLINTYISFAFVQIIPKEAMSFTKYSSLLLFFVFLILLTLANKYLFEIHQYGSGLAIWQVFVMSFLEIMLLISIIFSFLSAKEFCNIFRELFKIFYWSMVENSMDGSAIVVFSCREKTQINIRVDLYFIFAIIKSVVINTSILGA